MRLLVTALLCSACVPVHAQHALFLTPSEARARAGTPVELHTVTTVAAMPWPADRTAHFFARTAWTQDNRDRLDAPEGQPAAAAWVADRPGVLMLGIDLAPRVETIEADVFAAFVAHAFSPGAFGIAPAAEGAGAPIDVLRIECAKALVWVEPDGPADGPPGDTMPDSIATSKTGQPVEIRPLMDPTRLPPSSDLPVRVYASLEGATPGWVIATNATTNESVRTPVDSSLVAHIGLPSAGRWRLEFHALRALDGAGPSYEQHTATLTFDVQEAAR